MVGSDGLRVRVARQRAEVAGVCLRGRPDGLKVCTARQRAEAGSDRVVSSSCGVGLCVRSSVCAFRVESPSLRVQRVNDALHGNSHNSFARSMHAVHNACEHVIHGVNSYNSGGECTARGRGVCRDGRTKPQSLRTRSGVRRSLEGALPVGDEPASILRGASEEAEVRRPLEGLVSVGDELASDLREASVEVHVETREGRTDNRCGTRWVELGQGCGVEVKIPTDPERDLRLPGPGIPIREQWGWKPLLRTSYFGNLGSSWCSSGSGSGWGTGSGCCLGAPRHLPHSMGGRPLDRLPMLVLVWARPSYRATYRERLLAPPL